MELRAIVALAVGTARPGFGSYSAEKQRRTKPPLLSMSGVLWRETGIEVLPADMPALVGPSGGHVVAVAAKERENDLLRIVKDAELGLVLDSPQQRCRQELLGNRAR
ncbi:hypothetical protein Avi_9583 (plasmid) [Allorhizobium ampelinum S4]|uniref:Uncharacterized protein n=1 Tax=Allorhizobium ampelinum (strain ATCC BAA-846 / DSM 112012 / S4) TaxID=311402 RepID=B9K364_ALLAM|nr:hypothetical protein Avi_9583 [Allorhizobium ampelinum S4]